METKNGQIAIYQSDDGQTQIDVRMEQDSIWLRQEQMGELFGRERSVISKHLRNIFTEGELEFPWKFVVNRLNQGEEFTQN